MENNISVKTWRVPVTWEVCAEVLCKAPTLEEAMRYARDDDGVIPLPDDDETSYVDGSWRLSEDDIEIVRELYNDNQEDS